MSDNKIMDDNQISELANLLAQQLYERQSDNRGSDITLDQFFQRYADNHLSVHTRSLTDFIKDYRLYLSHWGVRMMRDIKRMDIVELQSELFKARGKSASNKAVQLISMMYNKAIDWGLLSFNPAAKLRKHRIQSRERFLMPEDLPLFFNAVKSLRHQTSTDVLLMLLFTAQRRRDVCEMRWDQIDFKRKVWRIPKTKNGTSHNVPLVKEALEILDQRKAGEVKHLEWVFPKRNGSGPIRSLSMAWSAVLKQSGLRDLRIHDLRRSHASWQAITGVNTAIIGATLNHKDPKSTAIYARLYLDPVERAMQQSVDAMCDAALNSDNEGGADPLGLYLVVPKRPALMLVCTEPPDAKEPRKHKPKNAEYVLTNTERASIKEKIISQVGSSPRMKSHLNASIGGFRCNARELQNILDEMVNNGVLNRVQVAPNSSWWHYCLPQETRHGRQRAV